MATKSIAWDSGGGYIRLTYTGSGNGTISVESDDNTLGTARSQVITVKTTQGGLVTKNLTVNQAACPFPVGDVKSYSYTGTVQSVLLPAGTYKLQCWGAQGGSNAAASSYGITVKAGGKGGYSEGVLTLTQATTVYIFVGGQGSSSGNGGWNGGGGGSGSSSYNYGGTNGVSRMGGGGGATDIALTTSSMSYSSYRTNRSSASLLSRMIVAGGGGGGAMCYSAVTTTVTSWQTETSGTSSLHASNNATWICYADSDVPNHYNLQIGKTYRVTVSNLRTSGTSVSFVSYVYYDSNHGYIGENHVSNGATFTVPNRGQTYTALYYLCTGGYSYADYLVEMQVSSTVTTTSNNSQVGYVGGGSSGDGYSSTYQGKQNAAGSNGDFGLGSNQRAKGNRYTAGCGGGGWYGGGSNTSDSSDTYIKYSGGGSGFVNTSESAGNRPSGYTGLQLDSGETKAGNTSFPSTSGGTETGHSGNGYCKITRLA